MVLKIQKKTGSNWSEITINCCLVGKGNKILQGQGDDEKLGAYTVYGRFTGKDVNFACSYAHSYNVYYTGTVNQSQMMGTWSNTKGFQGVWRATLPSDVPEVGILLETEVWKLEYCQQNRWHPFDIEIHRDGKNVTGFGHDGVGPYTVTGIINVSGPEKSLMFSKKYNTHHIIYSAKKIEKDGVTVSGIWWQKTCKSNTGKFRGKLGTMKKVSVENTADKTAGLIQQWMSVISEMKESPPNHDFNVFLSHVQKDSQDTCRSISQTLLNGHNIRSWYDMEATTIDAYGMIEGIAKSDAFLLFATRDYFARPWCLFEAKIAKLLKKPVVIVRETDLRHGGTKDFDDFVSLIPKKFRDFLETEILELNRRGKFWDASMAMIAAQVKKLAGLKGLTPPPSTKDAVPLKTVSPIIERLYNLESEVKEFRFEVNSKLDKLLELMSLNTKV